MRQKNNAGIFGFMPDEILTLILPFVTPEDCMQLAQACHWIRINMIKDESSILRLFGMTPIEYRLDFIETFFRPITREAYQSIKHKALDNQASDGAYLAYALLTDDINELDEKKLREILKMIQRPDNTFYLQFKKPIMAIIGILTRKKEIFLRGSFVVGSDSQPWIHAPMEAFFNFSGAVFPADFFTGKKTYDLRFSNLENTTWPSYVEGVCARWASLRNANITNAHLKNFSIRYANCGNINFKGTNSEGFNSAADMKYVNFEYGNFENISGNWYFKDCKLKNATFTTTWCVDFSNCDLIPYFEHEDLTSLDKFNTTILKCEKNLKYSADFDESITSVANNICDLIKSSPIENQQKIGILGYAINHAFFKRSNGLTYSVLSFLGTRPDSPSQKILKATLEDISSNEEDFKLC